MGYLESAVGEMELHSDTKNYGLLLRGSGGSQQLAGETQECLAQERLDCSKFLQYKVDNEKLEAVQWRPLGCLRNPLCSDLRRERFVMKDKGCYDCIGRNTFTMRTVRQWHRLSREAVQSPPLKILETWLDKKLNNLV